MNNKYTISVIVVNYKCHELTTRAVKCVLADEPKANVIVVDNSVDDIERSFLTRDLSDFAYLFFMKENVGFGNACNFALRHIHSEFVLLLNPDVISDIISRIEKYVDHLYIDEVQDFAGNDFSFLKKISSANVDMLFVGDFFQHTFDTSRDASVNKSLHDNYSVYIKHWLCCTNQI